MGFLQDLVGVPLVRAILDVAHPGEEYDAHAGDHLLEAAGELVALDVGELQVGYDEPERGRLRLRERLRSP